MRKIYFSFFALLFSAVITSSTAYYNPTASIQVSYNEVGLNLPKGLLFHLTAQSDAEIQSISLLYGTDGRTCQESASRQILQFEPSKHIELKWVWDFYLSGILPPGTQLWWQWEITDSAGNQMVSDKRTITVEDQRHEWRSLIRDIITVQWYKGSEGYGWSMLSIATDSMKRLEDSMGIDFNDPIRINIYPTIEEVREAIVHAYSWTAGVALPDYNNIIIGVPLDDQEWSRIVIPHELTHLVVEALVFNCQGVEIPTWLNEGLAVYIEGPIQTEDKQVVLNALDKGKLPKLNSLERGFSPESDKASLAYTQSAMVVNYMIDEYGPDKLGDLMTAIQSGNAIDKALIKVYSFDTDQLDTAWREHWGYKAKSTSNMTTQIITTKTQIPTLALWTPIIQASKTATGTPAGQHNASPTQTSLEPLNTTLPYMSTSSPVLPGNHNTSSTTIIWIGTPIGIVLIGIFFFIIIKRRKVP